MNLDEANKIKEEILGWHLKDEIGIEITHITIPNPDKSKYEDLALKIKKTKFDKVSLERLVNDILKKHQLVKKDLHNDGYLYICTMKK